MYKKVIIFILSFMFVFFSCSCEADDFKEKNVSKLTSRISRSTSTSTSTNRSVSTEIKSQTINLKSDYSKYKLENLTILLPAYLSKTKLSKNDYTSDIYSIVDKNIYMGISKYTGNEDYPDRLLMDEFIQKASCQSKANYIITNSFKNYFNIEDSLKVDEALIKENDNYSIEHITYRYTGYMYTNFFNSEKVDEAFIYFYSNIFYINKQVYLVWVTDLSATHKYQKECATILNDIIMKNFKK